MWIINSVKCTYLVAINSKEGDGIYKWLLLKSSTGAMKNWIFLLRNIFLIIFHVFDLDQEPAYQNNELIHHLFSDLKKKIRIGYVLKSADVGTLFSRRNSENLSHTPAHTCAHPHTPAYTREYPSTPANTRAHPCTLTLTHAHPCIPTHSRAYPHTPMHTCTHSRTPTHTCTHPTHTHWCPLMPLTW